MPKVSVIIPIFGVEKYIERCARSLFEQTLDEIEYIFIDDCTTDGSIKVLKQVLKEYPQRKAQVTIHRMDQNSGQAKVREWGVKNAKGEYVIHCDSDDWVEVDMYHTMYEKAKEDSADIVSCNYYEEYGSHNKPMRKLLSSSDTNVTLIKRILKGVGNLNSLWSILVSRKLYEKIEYPSFNQSEDFAMVTQFFLYSSKSVSIDKYFYHYSVNPQSISHNPEKEKILSRLNDAINNRKFVYKFIEEKGLGLELKEEIVVSKSMTKCFVLNAEKDSSFKSLWNSIFPEVNKKLMFSPLVPTKLKCYHLLVQLNLTSF